MLRFPIVGSWAGVLGGPPPPNAYPTCGREGPANGLTCELYTGCE